MAETLVLHARRGVNALSALGCLLAVVVSLWLYRSQSAGPAWNVVLLTFVAVFGVATVALVRRVLDRRPVLTVDDWGIRDRRTGVAAPWQEIERVHLWRQELRTTHVDWIALDVSDPAKVRPGALNQSRALQAVARAMGAPPVLLNTSDLTMPQEAVLAELQRRHAARR